MRHCRWICLTTAIFLASPVAIIGAGVSGVVLARVLAESQIPVHVFEARHRYGGTADIGRYPFTLDTEQAKNFLDQRMRYNQCDPRNFYPLLSWNEWCYELLHHPNILSLHTAPVTNIRSVSEYYDAIFSSVSPDALLYNCYGTLSYHLGIPVRSDSDIQRYDKYRRLLDSIHVYSVGMYGCYQPLAIETCINRSIETGQCYIHHTKAGGYIV
jgi:hypothetical protein